MRCNQLYFPTLKEIPADAKAISHQLMLRAGMIRQLASGIYNWLTLGLRVLQKIEAIVREEMNNLGAQEILMPSLQPAELWKESKRWEEYGPELLRMKDRHQRDFCFGPTHEEVITDLLRKDPDHSKQLPFIFYQIQTKFRDEIRPRFGIMRAREFLMKDAYSFHCDKSGLSETYKAMCEAYIRIFTRLGLRFRVVSADTGNIGGSQSQEFQVLAEQGEDKVLYSDQSDYAANAELAESLVPTERPAPSALLTEKQTLGKETPAALSQYLGVDLPHCLQLFIVKGEKVPLIGLLLRGGDTLNKTKLEKLSDIAKPLLFIEESEIIRLFRCPLAYLGPLKLSIPLIVDKTAAMMSGFVCGANKEGFHFIHVNWERDLPLPKTADLRQAIVGDPSPDGKGCLKMEKGIEVGHIFQLGTKYSEAMDLMFTTKVSEKQQPIEMGCYGIGLSRIVAAAIEQNHDQQGIIWPETMAPFQVVILPIDYHRSIPIKQWADQLYQALSTRGVEVLLDDRNEHSGSLFADQDLIGIPHRLILSRKNLEKNQVEYRNRKEPRVKPSEFIDKEHIIEFLINRLKVN